MTAELWIGLALIVASHWMLHRHAEKRYRIAAAWMMTGAFALASGFATQCFVRCETLQSQMTLRAAEPGKRMSEQAELIPQWTIPVDGGVLSFSGGQFPGEFQWPAKLKNNTSTSF